MNKYKVWECKIVVPEDTILPDGFDFPPRRAVIETIAEAGIQVISCFSGWGGKLDKYEQEVYDSDVRR